MATTVKLDDALIAEVVTLSGAKTKREAVTMAVQEFVTKRLQLRALELMGQIDFDPEYDYKKDRKEI